MKNKKSIVIILGIIAVIIGISLKINAESNEKARIESIQRASNNIITSTDLDYLFKNKYISIKDKTEVNKINETLESKDISKDDAEKAYSKLDEIYKNINMTLNAKSNALDKKNKTSLSKIKVKTKSEKAQKDNILKNINLKIDTSKSKDLKNAVSNNIKNIKQKNSNTSLISKLSGIVSKRVKKENEVRYSSQAPNSNYNGGSNYNYSGGNNSGGTNKSGGTTGGKSPAGNSDPGGWNEDNSGGNPNDSGAVIF